MRPRRALLALLLAASSVQAGTYSVGEKLHYRIRWGLVDAGRAVVEVLAPQNQGGVACHVFRSEARSLPRFDSFFPVRDVLLSYWDPVRRRTMFFRKSLSEGSYARTYEVQFHHPPREARWKQNVKKKTGWKATMGTTGNLPDQFQDVLSLIYFSRTYPRGGQPGDDFEIDVYDDLQLSRVRMRILERSKLQLAVNNRKHELPVIEIRPLLKTSGFFVATGDIRMWVLDDAAQTRLPVLIKSSIPFAGSITMELIETEKVAYFQ